MAFKMTPGIKGNPSLNRIKNLGACGGPGQPPCEPRFEKEVKEERKSMLAQDKSNYNKAKSFVKAKQENKVQPVKLKFDPGKYPLLKSLNEMAQMQIIKKFEDTSSFKSQADLDNAVKQAIKSVTPIKPIPFPFEEIPGFNKLDKQAQAMIRSEFNPKDFKSPQAFEEAVTSTIKKLMFQSPPIINPEDPKIPVLNPKDPIKEGPVLEAPIKGGLEGFESSVSVKAPVKGK